MMAMVNAFKKRADRSVALLWMLTIAGFFLRLYMAHADPFLHIWDERFHALVARNLIDHPLTPMLRVAPILPADPTSWTQGHIWLHKQPLFLWQMALSMKIFGVNEYALRYPSVLMGTLMIPMVYACCRMLSGDKKVSLLTAALFCFSNFHLELVGGMRSMDHNDLAFQFYVLAGIWAWLNYQSTGKAYWLLCIGLFSGAAILTKWLVGLFVYLLWGIKILTAIGKKGVLKETAHCLLSLLICGLVFVPWQYYITAHFPVEAAHEYAFNRRHITEVIEGHDGTVLFYLERFPQLFGEGIFLLIFPGIYLYVISKTKKAMLIIPVLLGILFVFSFFSFVAATKLVGYLFFIAPFMLMFMAYSISWIMSKTRLRPLLFLLLAGIGVLICKPEKIIMNQLGSNEERNVELWNTSVYKRLREKMPEGVYVVVNVPDCPAAMFYNKGIQAYETFTAEEMEQLKSRKIPVVLLTGHQPSHIAAHILRYPYLYKLSEKLY